VKITVKLETFVTQIDIEYVKLKTSVLTRDNYVYIYI